MFTDYSTSFLTSFLEITALLFFLQHLIFLIMFHLYQQKLKVQTYPVIQNGASLNHNKILKIFLTNISVHCFSQNKSSSRPS